VKTLLLATLAVGVLAPACAGEVRTIEVVIEHSRFIPARLEVDPGETVRFVVRNDDPIDHEFILGDAQVQLIHEEGTERHHGDRPGEISIASGATASTTYSFPSSGDLIFGCHLPQHYDYGMRGTVTIGAD
jgi:uncharacterized cupredoxin-like copper-binding protein